MNSFGQSVVGLVFVLLVVGCADEQVPTEEVVQPAAADVAAMTIDEAKEEFAAKLISMPGVAGVGVSECDGKPCIKVMLEEKTPELMAEIPSRHGGFEVVVEETGEIRALEQ